MWRSGQLATQSANGFYRQLEENLIQDNEHKNMTEKQRMLAGEMYDPADPELAELRLAARLLFEQLNTVSQQDRVRRDGLIRQLFGSTGEQIQIESPFHCDYGENIHVGENFFANFGCVILDVAEVRFGDNCMLAPQVGIYTATHPLDPAERNSGREYARPITVGDNCWIGGMAVINPGVTLGNNVVVASGAVVTKSFGDNVVVAGNPAKVIRTIEPTS
ncbi:sugar O-acetyltransferase [Microbulbifer elongatus]|nr:sugar O-acetyltransferase [Microbulbifer elongatus]